MLQPDGKLKIAILNYNCNPLTPVWRTDLVLQRCTTGEPYLVDIWPAVLTQLKDRYSKPATIVESTEYSTLADQAGNTVIVTTVDTLGISTVTNITLQAPARTPEQICKQLQGYPTFGAELDQGHVRLTSVDKGHTVSLTVDGTAQLTWGYTTIPITVYGGGYKILSHYYQGAKRIMLQPPSGEYVNYVEVDVPRGCYKVWTRCCFGANEETHTAVVGVCCGDELCVNLYLPALKACSGAIIHPLMREVVRNQMFINDDERLIPMRALMHQAGWDRQAIQDQLAYQRVEAEEAGLGDMVALIDDMILLAEKLPVCC